MTFREDVEVLLTMESNFVEHTKGAEIGINKLVSTVSELRHLHTDKLDLSYGFFKINQLLNASFFYFYGFAYISI